MNLTVHVRFCRQVGGRLPAWFSTPNSVGYDPYAQLTKPPDSLEALSLQSRGGKTTRAVLTACKYSNITFDKKIDAWNKLWHWFANLNCWTDCQNRGNLEGVCDACNYANQVVKPLCNHDRSVFGIWFLERAVWVECKLAVRACARVGANRKHWAKDKPVKSFKPTSVDYDARILRLEGLDG